MYKLIVVVLLVWGQSYGRPAEKSEKSMHPPVAQAQTMYTAESDEAMQGFIEGDTTKTNWWNQGQNDLASALQEGLKLGIAKNVIIFVGDGMGVTTTSLARIFKAQQKGVSGNAAYLSWEQFPHASLARTYTTNSQTADSAATATAMVAGIKTNNGMLGITQEVQRGNCSGEADHQVNSIIQFAQDEGKWTGIVSTARITHATPASGYAHISERGWEANCECQPCVDIASQLVTDSYAKDIRVILGGGRQMFFPDTVADVEDTDEFGERSDGRDLIQEWKDGKEGHQAHYVTNKTDFENVNVNTVDYLFGLFESSHMQYEADRDDGPSGEPSLAQMVKKSIDILKRQDNGYVLLAEGGRIDHAHHANSAHHAMWDTIALQDAVQMAVDETDQEDTLIIVTADHSHAFTFQGYSSLPTQILGFGGEGADDKPYTVAGYSNGPGYKVHRIDSSGVEIPRMNITNDTTTVDYIMDAGIWLESETHGGEDVSVHAIGPMSHLIHGVREQSYVAHVMMYASCIGPNKEHCNEPWVYPGCPTSSSNQAFLAMSTLIACLSVYLTSVFT